MKHALPEFVRDGARWFETTRLFSFYRNSSGDPRYLYLPLFWWLAGLLTRRRTVRLGDVSFSLQCDNHITHFRWFLFRTKEVEVREFIDTHVPDGGLFMDIGANIGVFTLYAGKRHPRLRVASFEPEYSNLHYLKENILANGLSDRVSVFSVAVSDQAGLSRLYIQDTTPGAAVHSESRTPIDTTAEGFAVTWSEGVSITTLDTACAHLGEVPDALKIDTDGNEAKILAGGTATLADRRLKAVAIEMPMDATDEGACRSALEGSGFSLIWSHPSTRNEIWSRAAAAS